MIDWFVQSFNFYFSWEIPTAFSSYSTKMLLASFSSLLFVIVLGPMLIKKLENFKAYSIRTEDAPMLCQLHQKKKHTPTMGGLLILSAMLLSMLLWMDLSHSFSIILLVTTLFFGALGARDDFLKLKHRNSKGISSKEKFTYQVLLAGSVAGYLLIPGLAEALTKGNWFHIPVIKESLEQGGVSYVQLTLLEYAGRFYLPFIKEPIFQLSGFALLFAAFAIMFVIVGSSNAVNLTDGLDGLAAGCLVMVGTCLAFFAFVSNHLELSKYLNILYVEGSGEIAIYLSALVGACIGFLWYNGSPAQIFMGDTGSLALGGVIGVSAVLLKREALLGVIGIVFVAETASVILQVASYKFRNKKRIFLCAPLHHHFECKGWPETKVVIRFWIVGLLMAIVGVASLKLQ